MNVKSASVLRLYQFIRQRHGYYNDKYCTCNVALWRGRVMFIPALLS